jgi:hypothetical protein
MSRRGELGDQVASCSRLRLPTNTAAPAAASPTVTALPIPLAPPVTTAVIPSNRLTDDSTSIPGR